MNGGCRARRTRHAETLPAAQAGSATDDDPAAAAGDPPAAAAGARAAGPHPRAARKQRHARAGGGDRATGTFEAVDAADRSQPEPPARQRREHRRGRRRGLERAERRPVRDPLEQATTTSASRNSPTTPASRCRNTCCGSWSWRSSSRASWRSRRAIVDAINDDGYLTESLEEIANTLQPEIECDAPRKSSSVLAVRAGARSRRASARARSASASSCSCGSSIRTRPASTLALADRRATTWSWSPSASSSLLRRELRATEEELAQRAGAGALLPSAPGRHRQRRQRRVRGARCVRAPHRARLGRGDQLRHAAARAPQPGLRQPDRPQRQPRHACAPSCRRRAGC